MIEFQYALEVRKQHFHFFPLFARLSIALRLGDRTGYIARRLMGAAIDFAHRHVRAALRLERTSLAVVQAGAIAKRILPFAAPGWLEVFASRADITIVVFIEGKSRAPEGAVVVLGLVPYRDMRRNPLLIH